MPYDPRRPRPNPELKAWESVIARECAALRRAASLAEKRGTAAILREALEMYLAEPTELVDLAPGVVSAALSPVRVGEHLIEQPSPFSSEGGHEGEWFYQGGDGSITPLLTAAQCAGVDPWRLAGYSVSCWRRIELTATATRCHLTDETALERIRPRARRPDLRHGPCHAVLLDPAGLRGGRAAPVLAQYRRLQDARRCAETLAGRLEIRCLVAWLERVVSTR